MVLNREDQRNCKLPINRMKGGEPMPRPPFAAEVKRIFTPNRKYELKALLTMHMWDPSKEINTENINCSESETSSIKNKVKEAG